MMLSCLYMYIYLSVCHIFIFSGYYCPPGTIEFDQFPCDPGTYGIITGLKSADECSPCPAGYVCGYGTTKFGMICSKIFFCFAKPRKLCICK